MSDRSDAWYAIAISILILAIGFVFFLNVSDAQVLEGDNIDPEGLVLTVDITSLTDNLRPLVSSSKIIYTKNGYARTPDMLTPQYDYLFSEIDRYQQAYYKCAGI